MQKAIRQKVGLGYGGIFDYEVFEPSSYGATYIFVDLGEFLQHKICFSS